MKEKDIAKKLEPVLHLIPNGCAIGSAIYLAVKHEYAPLQNSHTCWVGVYPQDCLGNPDIECERGSMKTPSYAKWLGVIPFCTTYFIMLAIMIVIIFHIVQQKRRSDRWRLKEDSQKSCCGDHCAFVCFIEKKSKTNTQQTSDDHPKTSQMNRKLERMRQSLKHSHNERFGVNEFPGGTVAKNNLPPDEENVNERATTSRSGNKLDPLAFNTSKVKHMIRRESKMYANEEIILSNKPLRRKSASNRKSTTGDIEEATHVATTQCFLYIASFLLCYTFTITSRIYGIIGRPAPFPVLVISRFFLPLQGFFVILIYSRPHIKSIRVNDSDLTWSQAFMIALKGGGDNDSGGQTYNTNLVIDPEGIDAPRLPEEERKRRQEIIRQSYLKRASVCSSYHRQRSLDDLILKDKVKDYCRENSLPASMLNTSTVAPTEEQNNDKNSTREEYGKVVGKD